MLHPLLVDVPRSLSLIRLYTPNITRVAAHQLIHQLIRLRGYLLASRGRDPARLPRRHVREQILNELLATRFHQIDQVLEQHVAVLLTEAVDPVVHVACVVLDDEIRDAEDARRRRLGLDQVAHDLVIEKADVRPADALLSVLLLLGLQRQLDEDLLQLLVHIVDTELLEAVLLEDLEAVDVQDARV